MKKMKCRKCDIISFLCVMCALFTGGITFINSVFHESWKLFVYDVRSFFCDSGNYVNYLLLFLVCYLLAGLYLWQSLFGKLTLQWTVTWKNKREWKYTGGKLFQKLWGIIDILSVVIIVISVYKNLGERQYSVVKNHWNNSMTVGHSFGRIGEDTYTGSVEAFEKYYALGQRTFEVDLAITADHKLVLKHDWDFPWQSGIETGEIPTEEEFLDALIMGRYTPMTFLDLCEIMQEHPDIWIVTDSKSEDLESVKQEFDLLLDTVREAGCEDVLERIVVQVYNEEMHTFLRDNYDFDSYVFTLYQRWHGTKEEMVEVSRYCANNGIEVITLQNDLYDEEIQEIADRYQLKIYLHTVNDIEAAREYLNMGVTGIYTDILVPDQLEED